MTSAPGFPEEEVRRRARTGAAAAFPPADEYGQVLFGAAAPGARAALPADELDTMRLVPPILMPRRLEKLIELGREPMYGDVDLTTAIGGFTAPLPVYVSALGSTRAAGDPGLALSRQAGALGVPMVIGENVVPVNGYGRLDEDASRSLLGRLRAYAGELPEGLGGVAVQQSTEDADAEVWNLVYSDPSARGLLDSGRLAFELKTGQGAKPGLGGMTVLDAADAARLDGRYGLDPELLGGRHVLRSSSPGTFTAEILRQQIRLMRNNFPKARIWVKLHPGRDVAEAARVAADAGADAVTVDGAEGGTGWAPLAFTRVGLPLAACLRRLAADPVPCLLVSGRMWEGARAAKSLALGARAVGLGRAALLAVAEDQDRGLNRFVDCLAAELRLLISALGKYSADELDPGDLWTPGS